MIHREVKVLERCFELALQSTKNFSPKKLAARKTKGKKVIFSSSAEGLKKVCFFLFLIEIVNRIQSKLNASYNCIDRHLETRRDQTAFIWEGDDQDDVQKITYGQGL